MLAWPSIRLDALNPPSGGSAVVARGEQTQDATRLAFPLPLTITLLTLAVTAAAGVWRIENRVSRFETAFEYERQLDAERTKTIEERFRALEAKIEAAGLRNAAMVMSQELQKQQQER